MSKDVLRLKTVNVHTPLELELYTIPETPDSEYVVDDSCFIPMSEAIKQLGSNNIGSNDIKNFYDFPDGQDNGMEIPITRTKNGKDIAEISSHIMDNIDDMTEKVKAAKDYQNRKEAFEKSISDIKSSAGTTESSE